jgi:hypothetical protein
MQYQPNDPITITLTAQEWTIALGVLETGPYRTVAPLITRINEQAQGGNTAPGSALDGQGGKALPHPNSLNGC